MNATNPYASPQSTVTDAADNEIGEVRVFSAAGRIGRVRYLGYAMGLYLVGALLVGLAGGISAALGGGAGGALMIATMFAVYAALAVIGFMLAIQRIHDFDTSGWLSLLLFVPGVNGIFGLLLLFIPGTRGRNRFGPQPPPNSVGVTILAAIGPLFFVVGILAAIAIPAYNQYIEQARQQDRQDQVQAQNYEGAADDTSVSPR